MASQLAANAGDAGSIPGGRRLPAGRQGNPLQYSCLENPVHRGTLRATVHGVKRVDGMERHAARWLVGHILVCISLIRLFFLQLFLAGRGGVGN